MFTYQYKLEGLNCDACLKIIKKRVGLINGINLVEPHLNGDMKIEAEREIDKKVITEALKDTDYKVL